MILGKSKLPLLALSEKRIKELIYSLTEEPEKVVKYRTSQLCDWIFNKRVYDFSQMTNLPNKLRKNLDGSLSVFFPKIRREHMSIDGTKKFLLELKDSKYIEMVTIPDSNKITLCLSSQIGCARNCSFCATARIKHIRNLTVDEIIGQVIVAQNVSDKKITNLVFMGMGEPLDNYDNVCEAIRLLHDKKMLSFSPRRTTLSTCGIVPSINRLLADDIKLKLAVSLNSANQQKREYLMPVAKKYPLPMLKKSLLNYQKKRAFRITFEYVMIKGINTTIEDAKELMSYVGDLSAKINLIPWNASPLIPEYHSPTEREVKRFVSYFSNAPCAVTYRKSRGSDISAACGQLITDSSNVNFAN